MAGIQVDGANQKVVLDSDGDTYLEAATDDTIKVYVAGAHDATISANAINVLSGTTLTIDSGATITNSGTANGFSSANPASADGDTLGTASLEWSDLFLADGGIIKFGNDQDTLLTHTDGTGLTLNSTNKLTFGDAASYINQSSDGVLTIAGEATIDLTASTAVLVSNDLKLDSDSSVIGFGADNDTTLTHTDGTGLTLNSTNKLCFNDATQFIQGASGTVLDIAATDEIELTATLIDVVGTLAVSGTATLAGILSMSDGSAGAPSITNTGDTNTGLFFAASDEIGISIGGAEKLRVNSSGHLGINQTTPAQALHISKADSTGVYGVFTNSGSGHTASNGLLFGIDSNEDALYWNYESKSIYFGTAGAEAARFDSNGYFLMDKTASNTATVGTESHGTQIHVTRADEYASFVARKNGDDGEVIRFMRDGNTVGEIEVNSSSTAYNTSSDYRLKENVDYDFDATTRLKQLKPARFNWIIDDTNTLVDGFLAHEVSSIIPEAITGTKDKTETKSKVVLNADGTLFKDNIEEADWIAGKSNKVLYTDEDILPKGKNIGDVKTEATYKSDTTWEASKEFPIYQSIDQSKLVPLMVKTIQELEARIKTLEDA